MNSAKLTVKVMTIENIESTSEADIVLLPGAEGELGVLPGHAPVILELVQGVVVMKSDASQKTISIKSGVAKITSRDVDIFLF